MWRTTTRALLLGALATLALAGPAQAKQVQQYFYSGEQFEAGGSNPAAIAFDGVNQKILVVGNGDKAKGLKISKFQLNGDPAGFSGRSNATSFNTGEEIPGSPPIVAIAVDDSGTVSDGNFYVASTRSGGLQTSSLVRGYASDGTALSGFPISVPGACGLTVAPDGHLWVASQELAAYGEFSGNGLPTGRVLFAGKGGGCRIAIDSAGNFYVARGEHMAKYDSDRHFLGNLGPADLIGFTLDRSDNALFELFSPGSAFGSDLVTQVDTAGTPITTFGDPDPAHFSYEGIGKKARDLAVDSQTHKVYVLREGEVNVFSRDPSLVTVPTAGVSGVEGLSATGATITGTLDPDGIDTTDCHFDWGTYVESTGVVYSETAPCAEGNVFPGGSGSNTVTASIGGLKKGTVYHFRLSAKNANGVAGVSRDAEFAAADPPALSDEIARHITTESAQIGFAVNTEGADTDVHVEVGTDTGYGASFPVPDATVSSTRIGFNFEGTEIVLTPQALRQEVRDLSPETLYHYRVVVENAAGRTEGSDHTFRTFALPSSGDDPCPNAQARQQTSSAGLLDCRAYELVSAPDTGGYDVRSNLSPGLSALATSAQADDAALYSMRSGTIPGIAGHPTNRGADPYLAVRGTEGWSTRYLGIPSNNPFATGSFASPLSGFDSALDTFSFGGEEICDPCFADGSTNVPLRLSSGDLVAGMAGSTDPGPADPAGAVSRPLSPDGSHFVFGTTAQFEPTANSSGTDATIYSRDLKAGTTEVVSTDDAGATIANGDGVAELAVSRDGTRTVIGEELAADSAGNSYYRLYLHIAGTAQSVDLTPGTTNGALFDGMTADGSKVFFTSSDPLGPGETDESVDAYRDEVNGPGATTPQRLSTGTEGTGDTDLCSPPGVPNNWNAVSGAGKCNVVAFAGGAGVASQSGDFYFLSPEKLDGSSSGTQDQANLYLVEPDSSEPSFVATIDSSLFKPPPAPPTRPVVTTSFGGSHNGPEALTVDQSNGDVYVVEPNSGRVSRYTSAGNPREFTEGPGAGTNAISGLSMYTESSAEVAVDGSGGPFDGDIYVTNETNIRVFSPTGAALGQLNGSGTPNGSFGEICGVAVDQSNGDVYVAAYENRIWRYSPTGAAPIDDSDYAVTGIVPSMNPCSVAADNGNVYASNYPSGPVRRFKASSFGGSPPNASGALVNETATALSTDPVTHELYVDEGSRIVTFNPAGEQQMTLDAGQLSNSRGVAVNAGSHHVYAASGASVIELGYEFEPYEPIDNPAIIHGVKQAGTYDSSDFQITEDGNYVAFASAVPIDGYESSGHYEVFRFEAGGGVGPVCLSCSFTTARPESDATLTPYGLSLLDDGRVFFTSGEQLTLRDTNEKLDAYEWEDGKQELISTGTSPSDASLLSVSADGKNAFFFTRQKLVPQDNSGSNVRLYTAREDGGFAFGPPQFSCAASDECHGASTPAAPPLAAGTTAGTPGQFKEAKAECRKGKVKRKGKCVARHQHKRHSHKRAAKTTRGAGK